MTSVIAPRDIDAERPPPATVARHTFALTPVHVGVIVAACIAASTQFLFQRELYDVWDIGDIAAAWIRQVRDMLLLAAAMVASVLAARPILAWGRIARVPVFIAVVYAGACIGETAAYVLAWDDLPGADVQLVLIRAARWVPVGLAIAVGIALHHRATLLAMRTHETEMRGLDLERQAVELELQTLKSQIEPHFLFNTLATVRRLYESDRARGRDTLVNFIRYLRAAVPGMRERHTTLGHEVDLVAAYLGVLHARMDERLRYRIDIPAPLREAPLPPLSLATLVENAVKHGLSRLPEGGELRIGATADGGRMRLSVSDTGPGFTSPEGGGIGLANLRARLRAIYGDDASLHLAPNSPHGVVATLDLPAAAANGR